MIKRKLFLIKNRLRIIHINKILTAWGFYDLTYEKLTIIFTAFQQEADNWIFPLADPDPSYSKIMNCGGAFSSEVKISTTLQSKWINTSREFTPIFLFIQQ